MSNFLSDAILDPWGRNVDLTNTQSMYDVGLDREGMYGDLNSVLNRTPMGNPRTAMTETMWGLNHRSLANSIPINKDYFGLTFFTRPDLCLSRENLRKDPRLAAMLDSSSLSLQRAIRAQLDARHNMPEMDDTIYPSELIDEKQVFMPILTNQLVSMSGWQDITAPTHQIEAGVYGEEYCFIDGIVDNYRTYDITANFRNIVNDPITYLFYYWLIYSSGVFQGELVPWSDNIKMNRIDYQTRIYRLVLDHTKRYVQKIAYCGAAFPIGLSVGQHFNFESDQPINRSNDQISITFRAVGAEYMNARCIYAFNKAVCMGNPSMYPNVRHAMGLRKIPYEYIYLFNYQGYPFINFKTQELEWYVYEDDLKMASRTIGEEIPQNF